MSSYDLTWSFCHSAQTVMCSFKCTRSFGRAPMPFKLLFLLLHHGSRAIRSAQFDSLPVLNVRTPFSCSGFCTRPRSSASSPPATPSPPGAVSCPRRRTPTPWVSRLCSSQSFAFTFLLLLKGVLTCELSVEAVTAAGVCVAQVPFAFTCSHSRLLSIGRIRRSASHLAACTYFSHRAHSIWISWSQERLCFDYVLLQTSRKCDHFRETLDSRWLVLTAALIVQPAVLRPKFSNSSCFFMFERQRRHHLSESYDIMNIAV